MHSDKDSTLSQSILVLGAGELGMSVLRNLAPLAARSDTPVTVLLRASAIESQAPGKQQDIDELRALGVKILQGDLVADSVSELAALFAPFHTVISCAGFVAGRGTQLKLTQAALEADVKRYFPWQFGVDYDVIGRGSPQDVFDEQLDVRDLLRAQKHTEWVIVSTGMFTSFLFEPTFGVVDLANDTVHALGSLKTAVTVTTPEDIGILTARIVFAEPRIRNQVVYTAGDTVTYARLADILQAVTGRTFERVEWSVPFLKAQLEGDPEDPIKKYRAVFAQGRGVAWDADVTFNAQQAINVVDVEHWARSHLC
ncbi:MULTISPECIES: aromatic alcohol reductase [unclassified Pseudomonas]|uniref:aromatic alcohol reductase n=1 Tax=unclassified Pseudomonas TaxID=196821 RepID=UPI0025FC9D41|nr:MULTISPECIES: aromatic alcohol reductase [unclassified Pseudomonas]